MACARLRSATKQSGIGDADRLKIQIAPWVLTDRGPGSTLVAGEPRISTLLCEAGYRVQKCYNVAQSVTAWNGVLHLGCRSIAATGGPLPGRRRPRKRQPMRPSRLRAVTSAAAVAPATDGAAGISTGTAVRRPLVVLAGASIAPEHLWGLAAAARTEIENEPIGKERHCQTGSDQQDHGLLR